MIINIEEKLKNLLDQIGFDSKEQKEIIYLENLTQLEKMLNQVLFTPQSILTELPVYIGCQYEGVGSIYYYNNGSKKIVIKKWKEQDNQTYKTIAYISKNNLPILIINSIQKDETIIEHLVRSTPDKEYLKRQIHPNLQIQQISFTFFDGIEHTHSELTTYKNSASDSILLQKYRQYLPLGAVEQEYPNRLGGVPTLIGLCGAGNRCLEIIYQDNNPIYAEIDQTYSLIHLGLNPNSRKNAKKCVQEINEEYNLLIEKVLATIKMEKPKTKKKINKKYPLV